MKQIRTNFRMFKIMQRLLNTYALIFFLSATLSASAQLYFPNSAYYNTEVERLNLSDTNSNYFNSHLNVRPILENRSDRSAIFKSEGKYYYWITQKLFKENFIIFKGEDFWCTIDPIADLELGSDFSADSLERLYWNTRGIRVQASFFDKVAFTTSVYENQAILPEYQREFADNHGEFFPNSINTNYIQNNAVIAGYSRTKPFKETGYDFSLATGNVSFVPNKFVNFQLGNGNQFIGRGYRSMLLSDFTVNYPFGKVEVNFWEDRIQYVAIYALHQNLYRLSAHTTPEATYEKKIGTYHYLDFSVTPNIQIGLFEGSNWRRVDSLGSHKPDFLFLNPVIFGNTAARGFEGDGYYSVLGLNTSIAIGKQLLYGQLVLDKGQVSAYQAGIKFYDLGVQKLDGGVEYNHANLNSYLTTDQRYNYSNYNLPLAHPLVAGFDELTVNLSYQHNRFFVQNRLTYSQRIQNDSIQIGNNILSPASTGSDEFNRISTVLYNQFEIGYRFNKNYNLEAVAGHLYRNQNQPTNNPLTNYAYIGIRTRLKNKTLDF